MQGTRISTTSNRHSPPHCEPSGGLELSRPIDHSVTRTFSRNKSVTTRENNGTQPPTFMAELLGVGAFGDIINLVNEPQPLVHEANTVSISSFQFHLIDGVRDAHALVVGDPSYRSSNVREDTDLLTFTATSRTSPGRHLRLGASLNLPLDLDQWPRTRR